MYTQTKPELRRPGDPPPIALDYRDSSCIDVGIQELNNHNMVVVYIRPSDAERTKHHNGAGNLETRTFQELGVNELNELFLKGLRKGEKYKFRFKTPVPSYGYIFELKLKHRIY